MEKKLLKQVKSKIEKYRLTLLKRASKKGLCENFGQEYVDKLEEEFNESRFLLYSNPIHKEIWDNIRSFDNWCSRVNDNDIRKFNNCTDNFKK